MSGSITIYQEDINSAVDQNIISSAQAEALWPYLQQQANQRCKMDWVHMAYGLGGSLIVGSLTWFTSMAWQDASGVSLFLLSSLYVACFGYGGFHYWNNPTQNVPQIVGGIFTMIAVLLSPVITLALERVFHYNSDNYPGFYLESTLFLASVIAIYFVRFPFLTAPFSFGIFALVLDNVPMLLWGNSGTPKEFGWLSVAFGVLMIAGFYYVDRLKLPQDFAFWGYLFGVLAFWGGLTMMYDQVYYENQYYKFGYFVVNAAMMSLSVVLQRNVFVIFGGLGCSIYVVDYFHQYSTVKSDCFAGMIFGSIVTGAAYYQDKKNPTSQFPFWGYLFGVSIFWNSLSTLFGWPIYTSQAFKFLYFLINVGFLVATLYTSRNIFLLYGLIGIGWYLGEIIYVYYWNSWWLPFILTALGLSLIAIAVYFSKAERRQQLRARLQNVLPGRTASPKLPETELPLLSTQY